jgi:2-desacetyl-2-hydroxyethyl bacteriochlorophyllide A dehydrogenase
MLALRKTAPAPGLTLVETEPPAPPGPGEVTLQIVAAGICGSDLHAYEWTAGYAFMTDRMPVTLGHEFAGRVAAVGAGVSDLAPGDRVTAWPTVSCGMCEACRSNRPQDCQAREIVGLHRNGGFARYVVLPARNCVRLPDGLDFELAALAEPLAVAANAIDVGGVRIGDVVAVLGPGPIGLGLAWLAQRAGAEPVILAGLNDALRLDCARRMGITHTVDLAHTSLDEAVARIAGRPADVVLEATGVGASVTAGLGVLRSSGVLVVAGVHAQPLQLDLTQLVRMKHQLRGAHDTRREVWLRVLRLLQAHGAELSQMISHRLDLADGVHGFELARRKDAVKVLLRPGDD